MATESTSVAVLGHRPLFRAGLATLLVTLGLERVAEADSLEELKQLTTSEAGIEILLVHVSDETSSVSQSMREIHAWLPNAKVVFLSGKL